MTLVRPIVLIAAFFGLPLLAQWHRDWDANPPVVAMPSFHGSLYVVGDVHGEFKHLFNLLKQAGLVRGTSDDYQWRGGQAVLVQLGDMIDKGDHALPAIDLLRALPERARRDGGQVIVLAGNHELGFLADPYGKKDSAFREEIARAGLSLMSDVYDADSGYGAWFRNRPAAAVIGGTYLSHSGWADGLTVDGISRRFRRAVDNEEWDSPFTCGDHAADPPTAGFFNADAWWEHGAPFESQLDRLGVNQVIFGHDPHAFKATGRVAGYFGNEDGRALIKADVGLVNGESEGVMYRCRKWLPNGGCAAHEILDLSGRADFQPLEIHDRAPDFEPEPEPRDNC